MLFLLCLYCISYVNTLFAFTFCILLNQGLLDQSSLYCRLLNSMTVVPMSVKPQRNVYQHPVPPHSPQMVLCFNLLQLVPIALYIFLNICLTDLGKKINILKILFWTCKKKIGKIKLFNDIRKKWDIKQIA